MGNTRDMVRWRGGGVLESSFFSSWGDADADEEGVRGLLMGVGKDSAISGLRDGDDEKVGISSS